MWLKNLHVTFEHFEPLLLTDTYENCTGENNSDTTLYDLLPLGWTITILTILSNSVIVVCTVLLLKKGEEPRCTYMLLGNIAVSDFLTGIIQLLEISPLILKYDQDTKWACIVIAGTNMTITLVSIYSVVLISIDRFLYIIHGIRYNQLMLPHKTGLAIFAVWMLGISLGMFPLFIWNNDISREKKCWYPQIAQPSLVIVESILGILPVLFVVVLYLIILSKAIKNIIRIRKMIPKNMRNENMKIQFYKGKFKQKQKTIDKENKFSFVSKKSYSLEIYTINLNEDTIDNDNREEMKETTAEETTTDLKRNKNTAPNKCKAIKVVLFTTGCFALTWVPYFILSIVFVTADEENRETWCDLLLTLRIASYIGVLNSFINPIIYAWWHNRFRESVRKLYCRRTKKLPVPQSNKG